MSLNNKYLAIGLSVVAVLVVFYQVFINKPGKPAGQLAQPAAPAFTGSQSSPVSPGISQTQEEEMSQSQQSPGTGDDASGTSAAGGEEGLVIDFNSPVLFNRVPHEMMGGPVQRDMPSDFGSNIFTSGTTDLVISSREPLYQKEIEFTLHAIIINPQGGTAIINGKRLRVGDIIMDAEVIAIEKGKVTLKLNDELFELSTVNRVKKISVTSETSETGETGGNSEN